MSYEEIGNVWKQEGIDIDLSKLTVSQATYAFFKKAGLQTEPAGSSAYNDSNFYLANIKGIDKGTVKVPTALLDAYKTRNNGNDLELDDKTGSGLGEFDYTSWSGWMITDDNVSCNTSAGAYLVDQEPEQIPMFFVGSLHLPVMEQILDVDLKEMRHIM